MIRRPPRSTLDRSSAASDVYKRQDEVRRLAPLAPGHPDDFPGPDGIPQRAPHGGRHPGGALHRPEDRQQALAPAASGAAAEHLSLIHISEPTRPY